MEYQKVTLTSAATFSKKLTNSYSFGGNSIYDGVFSSNIPAVKSGSRMEENYGEIFGGGGGSGGSSIPILDVPELNERKVSVDVNSSRLDYSNIFGGFGEFDFASSHEQLFATNPKQRDTFAEEPRTTPETRSCPSNLSEENQVFSRGASCQQFEGVKQFKMSYHKTNQGRENGINGTTHIAQLNAVPGYSCLINEVAPSQMNEGDKPSSVLKKSHLNINFSGEIKEGKDSRKTVSSLPTGGAGKQASSGVKFQKKSNQSRSDSIDMLFDTHENGHRTHPSKVPLPSSQLNNLGKNKGNFERSVSSKFGVSQSHSCEDATGFCSPPNFDEEVDSNSVAATSAAAVKKAIEEAQAKIRLAKEIMERKKAGLQNHVKLRFKDGSKAEERRDGNITNKSNKSREEAWDKCRKLDIPNQVFPGMGTLKSMKAGQGTPDLQERDKLFFTKEASGETKHGDENKSTLADHRQEEMKESEAEELGESGARVMHSMNVCEWEDESSVKKTFEKPALNGKKLKAVEEAHKQEEVKKLNAVKEACELKECANEPKSDQEVKVELKDCANESVVAGLQEETDTTSKSTVAGPLDETDSTVAGLQEKTDSTVAGLPEEPDSTVAGLLEEPDSTVAGPPEETDSTVAGQPEETDSTVAGQPAPEETDSTVSGLQEETDTTSKSTVAGPLEETDSTVAGLQEKTDSTVAGLQEKTDSTVTGLPEETDSTVAGLLEEPDSTVAGLPEETDSTVAGAPEETDSTVSWPPEETESTVSWPPEETESTVSGPPEVTDSTVAGPPEETDPTVAGLPEETDPTIAVLQEETDTTSKSTVTGLQEETDTTPKSTVAWLQEETGTTSKPSHRLETREKKQRRLWDLTANGPKSEQKVNNQEEYGTKSMVAELQEEIDTPSKASHRLEICEKKQRRLWDLSANRTKLELQELRDSDCTKTEEQKWLEIENKQEVLKLEENDIRSKDVPERGENKEELHEIFYDTENQDIPSREDAENTSGKAQEDEKIGVGINHFLDGEQSAKILEEYGELEVNEEIIEAEENGKILMEAYQMKEIEKKQKEIHGWLETGKIQPTIEQREADEKMEVTHKSLSHSGNSLESANGLCKWDKLEILSETVEASGHEENEEHLEALQHEERRGIMEEIRACREMETEIDSNADEMEDELEEKEVIEAKTTGLPRGLEFDKMQKQMKDATEDFPFEYNGVNVGRTDIDVCQKQHDQHDQHANESKTFCNLGKHVEELGCESEENFKDVEEVEDTTEQGEDESISEFSDEDRWNDIEEIVEAYPVPSIFQEKEETIEIANKTELSQNTEKDEENHSETPTTEEREAEGTLQKEVEREEIPVRKIDEAKEREREREKERIAVERAIREARERAFTDARERAERAAVERATAEARRRAMAEAREKLDKVSAEANDKLLADKSSMEARLKAQRAAVERATAEARERALEKAMSEQAAVDTRNQARKFSGASRDCGKRRNVPSNDCRFKGSGSTRSSGDPSSSNHGVTQSVAKSDKVNGESAKTHKATVERHQRTAERAAKALAEKNMRDLLAQKEQAERNRLAETLDADVKRWSSGKQGNLRALLSTLQYILGPDSSWQPVPLTDLITTTAVKKTYRKATLFVHPDKLQQRGASIQQKYMCEKVFDLLKEGWNKFSSEER
ncbi:hypothetical protein Ddye_007091 [Dipteronia dyeriana]|uniref:Auxilin-like protein 1 n=1 Tax=Dipteronia dyeriana TaxID=168575 RepID=A0AAD9XJP0_9ROSI|nr:hypothetical protein Ddye_007091 [Dipteronia dyeriana]